MSFLYIVGMPKFRCVLFDAGHTLIHPHPSLGEVYARVTEGFGVRIPPERFMAEARTVFAAFNAAFHADPANHPSSDEHDRGMWRAITARLFETLGRPPLPFDAWFEALYEAFARPEVWRPYPDALPLLDGLRARGLRLGIVSNWDSRLEPICEGLGLSRRIDFILISARVGVRKPARRIFERALELAGAAPDEALHVGDSVPEDVHGARAAGIRPVLIDRDGQPAPAGVNVIRSLAELNSILD